MDSHAINLLKDQVCISVEIKPKCGFLPFSRYISEGNVVEKRIVRFRMHQSLKLHEREVSEISEYDPLNMFSGSKDRVYKAIKALFVTPQNNFRVFLNGSIIYGGLGGGGNSISHMIGKEDILSSVIRTDDGLRTTNILHLVAKTVFRSGLLDQLLKLQKLDVRLRSNFAKMASYAPLFVNANDRRCMEFPISGCNAFFSESSGGTLLNSTLQANSSSSLIASAIAWKNS